jgi:GMP synthase-like glutamine amidotransferase
MSKAVCLQHVPFEGPGAFAMSLAKRGVRIEHHLVPENGLPNETGDLLIVMGGPMSVNDPDPWIAEETAFIRTALFAGQPVIGVCLGSQFMAKALGATVRSGKALEIGMTPVRLTDEGTRSGIQLVPCHFRRV